MSESDSWPTPSEMERFIREHTRRSSHQADTERRISLAELRGNECTKFYLVTVCDDGKVLRETSGAILWILRVTQKSMRKEFAGVIARNPMKETDEVSWLATLRFGCVNMGIDPAVIDVLLADEP